MNIPAVPEEAADVTIAASPITDLGGSVETDAAGRATGVTLGFQWVTDLELKHVLALKDLEKLDRSFPPPKRPMPLAMI